MSETKITNVQKALASAAALVAVKKAMECECRYSGHNVQAGKYNRKLHWEAQQKADAHNAHLKERMPKILKAIDSVHHNIWLEAELKKSNVIEQKQSGTRKKKLRCTGCGEYDTGHNWATCPVNPMWSHRPLRAPKMAVARDFYPQGKLDLFTGRRVSPLKKLRDCKKCLVLFDRAELLYKAYDLREVLAEDLKAYSCNRENLERLTAALENASY